MENACRFIINEIMEGNVKSKKELEKLKLKACRDFKLMEFMSNSLLLENATPSERVKISPLIRKKPTRTISGVAVVAVMCKPHKCPHGRCNYCPESDIAPPSYTGEEPAALRARMFDFDPYKQTYNRLLQLESIGHPIDKVELIVMGGTFPSYFICYQEWFVTRCIEAMNNYGLTDEDTKISIRNGGILTIPNKFSYLDDVQTANEMSSVRCVGMTFETRPDYAKIPDVDRMLDLGVTRVELGVQTIYNFIYKRIERGHRVSDVIESTRILRDSGLKVAMHLMPGLFSNPERDMRIFHRIFEDDNFKPDMLKIYPCLVTKGSEFYDLWKKGDYTPYTTEEAVDLIVNIKKMLPKWVRTMRIQRDIPSQLIEAGVKKSNLGELVYNKLAKENVKCQCIRCREVGHQGVGVNPVFGDIKLMKEEYNAGMGREIFLSHEDPLNDILIGFLRLRIPSSIAHRREVDEKTAIVRELHVYGQMAELGQKKDEIWQHMGYGEDLLAEAEKLALETYDKNKLLIISGVGARNYYRKFGYEREGPYMSKILK
ncbi:MAG: tRNA uridine(34) 5-carboxymethylaminomethyl modification radical SAM/GNAT enzyme Elp3 [Methanobacterium sp.]|uniref:tRNA uridine(34) 5-carboxymethylaminomethyl modification radical SAM/GNAT enzyme Elp3 n=1 Tax=Methanobacterium sp. TaxID=2164 RepID=UPI003C76D740